MIIKYPIYCIVFLFCACAKQSTYCSFKAPYYILEKDKKLEFIEKYDRQFDSINYITTFDSMYRIGYIMTNKIAYTYYSCIKCNDHQIYRARELGAYCVSD